MPTSPDPPSANDASDPGAPASPTLEALREGDEAAFLALVERHHGAMVRLARVFVRSDGVAEEVAQEAWLGVLAGLPRFERRASLRAWIFRILVNQAKARAAREARSAPLSALEDPAEDGETSVPPERFLGADGRWPGHWASPPQAWPEELVASREAVTLVGVALEGLPPLQRTVMTLRDVEGWESGEVCELLGVSEGHQRVLLHRARSAVRARLEVAFGEGTAAGKGESA